MRNLSDFKKELLQNEDVKKEYHAHQAEFDVARALIKARLAAKMTQRDVALRMHTSQAAVARLESGAHLPTLQTLQKYARAVQKPIALRIEP